MLLSLQEAATWTLAEDMLILAAPKSRQELGMPGLGTAQGMGSEHCK